MILTVDSDTYLTIILNLAPSHWDNQSRTLLSTCSNLVGILLNWDNLRRSGEAQELLHRKVGRLYDSYYSSSIMEFSYFFAKEVLISSSRPQALSGPLRAVTFTTLGCPTLCVLVDQESATSPGSICYWSLPVLRCLYSKRNR